MTTDSGLPLLRAFVVKLLRRSWIQTPESPAALSAFLHLTRMLLHGLPVFLFVDDLRKARRFDRGQRDRFHGKADRCEAA